MGVPALIRQADAKRLFAGAKQAGFTRVRIRVDVDGSIMVDADLGPGGDEPQRANPLDRFLNR